MPVLCNDIFSQRRCHGCILCRKDRCREKMTELKIDTDRQRSFGCCQPAGQPLSSPASLCQGLPESCAVQGYRPGHLLDQHVVARCHQCKDRGTIALVASAFAAQAGILAHMGLLDGVAGRLRHFRFGQAAQALPAETIRPSARPRIGIRVPQRQQEGMPPR